MSKCRHNIKSSEIRSLYDLLFRYEKEFYKYKNSTDTFAPALASLLDDAKADIYLGKINKANQDEAKNHRGYFLFRQSNDTNRCYWLIRHQRDTFAHGGIVRHKHKEENYVKFKERQNTLEGYLPDSLFIQILSRLPK